MRMHDIFGPRLEYYCSQRGKRYGSDWKIVFKYPAPTPLNPNRRKYFDLQYNMKPIGCRDKDHLSCAMRDGDTLLVVTRRAGNTSVQDNDETELGTQIECQHISIQNGETEVWQAPDVNHAWFRNADKELAITRHQLSLHHDELLQMRNMQLHRENAIAALQAQNLQLKGEIEMLRQGRLPYPATHQYGEQD
jgi:hypothetical protein